MPDKSDQPDILRHHMPPHLKLAGKVALCAAAAIVVIGIGFRLYSSWRTQVWTDDQDIRTVQVLKLKRAATGGDLILPGEIQAFTNAPIYARVSGYLKAWHVDIGASVKAGQVLADLDTPDLDGQVAQGRADLATAVANQQLAAATARRWNALFAQGAVSRQDKDTRDGDLAAKNAMAASARANLARLRALESFKHLTAPFDGVVTSRTVDVGALILVGTPGATPLFTVADQTKLRIYVHVPQIYSGVLKPGMVARFTVPEYPGREFRAALAASSNAVSSQSGTQLAQFQIDNADGALKPGGYAEMTLTMPDSGGLLRVPATALLFRDTGMMVATVDPSNHVKLKAIGIRADLGTAVEVNHGLSLADRVIDNPPDAVRDGDPVRVMTDAAPAANKN